MPGESLNLTEDLNIQWDDIRSREAQLDTLIDDTKYSRNKSRLQTRFEAFLVACSPPQTLYTCSPQHVRDFLIWKDTSGQTKVHRKECDSKDKGNTACDCPHVQAAGTVDSVLGQLRAIFRDHGMGTEWYPVLRNGNPAAAPLLKKHLKAVRKEQSLAMVAPKQATPLLFDKLIRMTRFLSYKLLSKDLSNEDRYLLLRDRAYFIILCHLGDRAGDIGLLQTEQFKRNAHGLHITIYRGKTLQDGKPRQVFLRLAADSEICPVQAFGVYTDQCAMAGLVLQHGHVFRPRDNKSMKIVDKPVTSTAMPARLKVHLQDIGMWDGETSHSARVGCSLTLLLLGVEERDIMAHIGWKSESMLHHYTRVAQGLRQVRAADTLASASCPGTDTTTPAVVQVAKDLRAQFH